MNTSGISVIIPVFNAELYLAEAIESVLIQEPKPLEIIVINDGSTDKSADILEKYLPDINLIQQENKGAASARNLGIFFSKGSFLAFLDADDIWMPDHQRILLQAFEKDPDLDMVMGSVEQFISPELNEVKNNLLREELKIMPGYHPGAILVKKESFLCVGMLNENLQLAEFVDWFSRAREMKLKHSLLPEVVYKRRLHLGNQGIYKREYLKDYISVLRAGLKRRKSSD